MTKFKGIFFPSFKEPPRGGDSHPNPDRSLPFGQSWISHQGNKQRMRYLRQVCAPALKNKDPLVVEWVEKLRGFTKEESNPEFTFLHLLFAAQEASLGTGASLVQSLEYMITKWQETSHSPTELVHETSQQA